MLSSFKKTIYITFLLGATIVHLKAQESITSIIQNSKWEIAGYGNFAVFYDIDSIHLQKSHAPVEGDCLKESLVFSGENSFHYCEPFIRRWEQNEQGIAVERQLYKKRTGRYQIDQTRQQLSLVFDTKNLDPNDLIFKYADQVENRYSLTYAVEVANDKIRLVRLRQNH